MNIEDGGFPMGRKSESGRDIRKIGNVDEGVVEGGEDTGNTENELACVRLLDIGHFFDEMTILRSVTYHHRREGRGRRSPWRREPS